jgi:RES domain-containing protein
VPSRARRFRYTAVRGTWYRLVRSGRDPLDFARTRDIGGRYNPPRSLPTLYLGDQPATCMLEVLVHAFELPATYDLVAVELERERVVDLASEAGRRPARVALRSLVAPPRPTRDRKGAILGTRYTVTWQLARLAWSRGADGLLVPAAALPVQRVLVLFERPGKSLTVRERGAISTDPRMRRLLGP